MFKNGFSHLIPRLCVAALVLASGSLLWAQASLLWAQSSLLWAQSPNIFSIDDSPAGFEGN